MYYQIIVKKSYLNINNNNEDNLKINNNNQQFK